MPEPKKLSAVNEVLLYISDFPGSSAKEIMQALKYKDVKEHNVNNSITVGKKAGFLEHSGYARYRLTDLAKSHMGRIMAGQNPTVPTPGSERFNQLHSKASTPTIAEIVADAPAQEVIVLDKEEAPTPSIREETINWLMEYRGVTNRLLDIIERFANNSRPQGE